MKHEYTIEQMEDAAVRRVLRAMLTCKKKDMPVYATAYKELSSTILGRMTMNENLKALSALTKG